MDSAPNNKKLVDITFNTAQILRILKNLKNKKSTGLDGLRSILFRQLASKLARPLAMIFNFIMQAGEVPVIWKKAIVVPVFKKGVSSNPQNYRPISLTCVGSKIFETAIKAELVPFLEEKNLISEYQHGFRKSRSTCLNLIESLDDWTDK